MRRALLALWCWLWWACRSGCVIPEGTERALRLSVGDAVTNDFLLCENKVKTCQIGWLAGKVADSAMDLRGQFAQYRSGRAFAQQGCDAFRQTIESNTTALRSTCTARGDWPGDCTRLQNGLVGLLTSPLYEIGVLCAIISPGAGKARMPQCSALVTATVARGPTLTACANFNKTYCVQNFCDLYTEFNWRIRPRNLQEASAKELYPEDFVLPGCEEVAQHGFSEAECPLRRDVNGFCDCICQGMPAVQFQNERNCPTEIDAYLLFGRMGVRDIVMNRDCDPELCGLFDSRRQLDQCLDLGLPSRQECMAMQLSKVALTCPWEQDSGEDGVLQCLDGHRCALAEGGWACCENHLGRGRCPRELPVMCDVLCSGMTEYCCGLPRSCTPRQCSPVLRGEPAYFPPTTTATSTTEPPGEGRDAKKRGVSVRLAQGSWVWLLLVVPVLIGIGILLLWLRLRMRPQEYPEPLTKLEEQADRLGAFYLVRPTKPDEAKAARPLVQIQVDHIPQLRPLGLELLETRVIRVYPQGKQWGWQVGDVILEVAGQAVASFEELWQHIQVERGRPPVRFLVERQGTEEEAEAPGALAPQPPPPQQEASPMRRAPKQAWFPDGDSGAPGAAAGGLPSALVGWQTWSYPSMDDEPRAEEEAREAPRAGTAGAGFGGGAVDRAQLGTTGFTRAFPLTPAAKLRSAVRRKDPGAQDVRWVRDAWGRSVARVGG